MSERREQYNISGYLSAYISGVKFFNYKFMNSEEFVRIKPVFWRFFPLHHNNIGDLLASGVTTVNCASYDFDGEGFVAIEPENHYTPMVGISTEGIQDKIIKITDAPMLSPKVTINMVRINGQNLTLLRKAIMWMDK